MPDSTDSNKTAANNSNNTDNDDILTITYRKDKHVYDLRKHTNVIDLSEPQTKPTFIQWVLAIFVVHYFLWVFVGIAVLYIVYAFISKYAALGLLVAYVPSYMKRDEFKLGRPWHSLRQHSVWHPLQRYLRVEAVRESKLDPYKQYIFGIHPHGILILSRPAVYGSVIEQLFPGIEHRVLGASPMFYIPGCRELCLWMNAVNADKKVANKVVNSNTKRSHDNVSGKLSLVIYPGGSKEIFTTDQHSNVTTMIGRKGFIKLALTQGLDIVPTFVFNEKYLYENVRLPKAVESFFMNVLRTPLLLFYGKWYRFVYI